MGGYDNALDNYPGFEKYLKSMEGEAVFVWLQRGSVRNSLDSIA